MDDRITPLTMEDYLQLKLESKVNRKHSLQSDNPTFDRNNHGLSAIYFLGGDKRDRTNITLKIDSLKGLLVPETPRSLLVYRDRSHLLRKELQKRLGRAV